MGEQASRVPVIDGAHPAQGPTHAAKALDRHDDDARIAVEKVKGEILLFLIVCITFQSPTNSIKVTLFDAGTGAAPRQHA